MCDDSNPAMVEWSGHSLFQDALKIVPRLSIHVYASDFTLIT
jgi:hypothetical protein